MTQDKKTETKKAELKGMIIACSGNWARVTLLKVGVTKYGSQITHAIFKQIIKNFYDENDPAVHGTQSVRVDTPGESHIGYVEAIGSVRPYGQRLWLSARIQFISDSGKKILDCWKTTKNHPLLYTASPCIEQKEDKSYRLKSVSIVPLPAIASHHDHMSDALSYLTGHLKIKNGALSHTVKVKQKLKEAGKSGHIVVPKGIGEMGNGAFLDAANYDDDPYADMDIDVFIDQNLQTVIDKADPATIEKLKKLISDKSKPKQQPRSPMDPSKRRVLP